MTEVARPVRGQESRIVRNWSDVALVGIGMAVLLLAAAPVDEHTVPGWEEAVFRALNDYPVVPFLLVWLVMQLGNVLVVPVAALVAAAFRRWRLAAGLLIGGLAAYYLAKVVKDTVVRGRPDALLDDVVVRGAAAHGRGFVSGHAAVVTLLAALAWPYLGRRGRILVVATACVVALARVYVGAHLPLDVLGGVGLGLALAGVVRLLLGGPFRPAGSPSAG